MNEFQGREVFVLDNKKEMERTELHRAIWQREAQLHTEIDKIVAELEAGDAV